MGKLFRQFHVTSQSHDALMVLVSLLYLYEVLFCLGGIAHAEIAQSQHVFAVNHVACVERIIPNEQVGKRNGKIVHHLLFKEMLLAVVQQLVESAVGLAVSAQFSQCRSLIEYLVGFGIVVIHGSSWFLRSFDGLQPILSGLLFSSQ